MHGHESEILTTTFLMLSAVSFGLILRWLKQPPLVGYILAGLALGPAGLGPVDHLDEISSVNYYGNQVKWNTNQSGAVGRMNTEGVAEMFYKLIKTQRFSEAQREFLNRAAQVYHESQNLSVAFRRLLHDYLGDTGLIIIDPDSKVLKSSFT